MKIMQCTAVLLALSVIACGGKFDEAKREVEKGLKDPASTQYRNMVITPLGLICGEFNSKNSMGGYVGFEQFIYYPFNKDIPNSGKVFMNLGGDYMNSRCK